MKLFNRHKKNPENKSPIYNFILTNRITAEILSKFIASPPTPNDDDLKNVEEIPMKRYNSIRYPSNVGRVGEKYKNK